jgi:rsbT co-antagonist protein RsbR
MRPIAITARQSHLSVFILLLTASSLSLIFSFFIQLAPIMQIGALLGTLFFAGMLAAYLRGARWPLWTTVVVAIGLDAAVILLDTRSFTPAFFIPMIIALMFTGPWSVALSGGTLLAIVLIGLPTTNNPYSSPVRLVMLVLVIAGMVVARLVLDTNARSLAAALHDAQAAQERAEQEAATARAQAADLQRERDEQQRLNSLVETLEIPSVPLAEGVLLLPIVGNLDSRRAQRLTAALLDTIAHQRTRLVILDLAGVVDVDTQVARALLNLIAAIKLLGCNAMITGIGATIATTMTHLGIDMSTIAVARSPQEALAHLQ